LFNADESGFPLCIKSGKVFAEKGAKHLYIFSSSNQQQITVHGCCSASGNFVPPMVIFPGQRFNYNPLEGAEEFCMGRSSNGWMESSVFYEWVANYFHPYIKEQEIPFPVVLFIDGHSSHVTLETANF
jgi:hypothetical protein